jgi:hypothetical protein
MAGMGGKLPLPRYARSMVELLFQLPQDDDGWPPVPVEGLWCEPLNGDYRLQTCPLFVKRLSVGDVIAVEMNENGDVQDFTVIEPSNNTTVWVMFWNGSILEGVLDQLRSIECDTTGPLQGWETPLCSVNVAAHIDMSKVDAILRPFERAEQIAVAYPSYRHPDGD